MSRIGTTDFLLEVSKGNVDRHSVKAVVAKNPSATTDWEDLWGGTGSMVYPTIAETWEIVSDSANDAALGAGARTVVVNSLDVNYIEQSEVVTLNGTTPVALVNSHYRPDVSMVLTAGSSEMNEGTITIRVAGGGAERSVIIPNNSVSTDGRMTVPAGKTAFTVQVITVLAKDNDGNVRTRTKSSDPDSAWITAGGLPYYQIPFNLPVMVFFAAPEKTDIRYEAKLTIAGSSVDQIVEFVIVEND